MSYSFEHTDSIECFFCQRTLPATERGFPVQPGHPG